MTSVLMVLSGARHWTLSDGTQHPNRLAAGLMSPERLCKGAPADARNRRFIATRYLEVAEPAATEEGPGASNVVVGIALLAGVAASDAICLSATGTRYAGEDHAEAARVLGRTDRRLGQELSKLVRLKPGAHYGSTFISDSDRVRALRAAATLVGSATDRTLLGS